MSTHMKYIELQMKNRILTLLLLFIAIIAKAQMSTTVPLPEDVRFGKLKNGMSYYIMHNEEPKDRVSFYFTQNVGAILEEDNEDGLAHFLEHIAFNGSTNFEGRAMTTYLESKGLVFGRDFNASTGTDETVYNINNVIASDEEMIDKCLLILHDWSGSLLLKKEEIDNERGVIGEEWRSGRNPDSRVREKIMPVLFAGSKYAERDVIGDPDFIKTFSYQSLRNFYKKWYRPDLQAVIVVGDIDVNKIEEKVKKLFSKIPLKPNLKERPYFEIPDNRETSYVLAKEKGVPFTSIQWFFKHDISKKKDSIFYRNNIAKAFFNNIMKKRIQEILQKPDVPASHLDISNFDLNATKAAHIMAVYPKKGKELESVKTILTELERVKRFGISEAELEREKSALFSFFANDIINESQKSNAYWARQLSDHYVKAKPVFRAKDHMAFLRSFVPTITTKEVSATANLYKNTENSIITVSGPDDKEINYPTKAAILDLAKTVKNAPLENYSDDAKEEPLVSDVLKEGTISSTFLINNIPDAKGYVLSNGVRVVLNPSKKEGENIMMNAIGFGGFSKVDTKDLPSAYMIQNLLGISGVGNFTKTQLSKKLSANTAQVMPSISDYTQQIEGYSNVKDFEQLLQLTYLYFTKPRFNESRFKSLLPEIKLRLEQSEKQEETVFRNAIAVAKNNNHPRTKPFTAKDVEHIDFEKTKSIYLNRFKDANDFTFVFTGNFEHNKALTLIKTYLGNLKTSPEKETWTNHNILPKKGTYSNTFEEEMADAQTYIFYKLSGSMKPTLKNKLLFEVVKSVLSTRYVDTIREEEGGSYGVGVRNDIQRLPEDRFNLIINFKCNPDKQQELLAIVKKEIDVLKSNGPFANYVEKTKKAFLKEREEIVLQDGFWHSIIIEKLLHNTSFVNTSLYNKTVADITPKKVKKFMKKYLKIADITEVVMNPKK